MAAHSRFVKNSKEFLNNLPDNSIPEKNKRATKYGMNLSKFFLLLDKTTNFFVSIRKKSSVTFFDKSFQYIVTCLS